MTLSHAGRYKKGADGERRFIRWLTSPRSWTAAFRVAGSRGAADAIAVWRGDGTKDDPDEWRLYQLKTYARRPKPSEIVAAKKKAGTLPVSIVWARPDGTFEVVG
jgi:hypothetical protein